MSNHIKVVIVVGSLGLFLIARFVFHIWSDEASSAISHSLDSIQKKHEQHESALEETRRRIAASDALIVALIEGRATLADVTAAFLAMHKDLPFYSAHLQFHYSGQTDMERLARDMANRASLRVADPAKREKLAEQLVSEFQTLFPGTPPLQFDPVTAPVPKMPTPPFPARNPQIRKPIPVPVLIHQ
jgi:hypothetical protein